MLVVGGDPVDPLYRTFKQIIAFAYWVLRNEGLPAENMRLLAEEPIDADNDGVSDVHDRPNLDTLRQAVVEWGGHAERLLVEFLDHGQRNRFRLNATDYLEASTYAGWLDQIQVSGSGPEVTTIIDTCEAGSFIDDLAPSRKTRKAGAKRITIASSGIGPVNGLALFDEHGVSFTAAFWEQVFQGSTYGQAFDIAKSSMEAVNPLQAPQIDDDGNGFPNEPSDGLVANNARPGVAFEAVRTGVFIGDVAEYQAVA